MRYAAGVEYDGSGYSGWQRQKHTKATLQACVERALSRVADHPIEVVCSGRTDRGVHGCGQVIHFDTTAQRSEYSWLSGCNANLPKDISLLWVKQVDDSFHARFSAQSRTYRYVIFNRQIRPSYLAHRVAWHFKPLDVLRMIEASKYLIGEHDFSSYRAMACQAKSPVRTLHQLDVRRDGELIFIQLTANGFLHHMVRNIAGVLMEIGEGGREPEWAREVLQAKNRVMGGVTASPYGLYFMNVAYPAEYPLPTLSPASFVW